MLKIRIIGVVLVKSGIVVQSIGFQRYLPIGIPEIAINYLDRWGVDEIIVLHIDAHSNQCPPSIEQVKSYASQCQVPLSIGGGISNIDHVKKIIRSGADKVVINTTLTTQPDVVTEASDLFGQQSIVASIDVRRHQDSFMSYSSSGKQPTNLSAQSLAQKAVALGAGEILLHSIDRDGTKTGFDLELIHSIAKTVHVPVIACGGAGHPKDLHMAIISGASAVAVGNFFHFTEHSVTVVKQYLNSFSEPIRLDNNISYEHFTFDTLGRPNKLQDDLLETLRFQYIEEEKI